VSLANYRVTLFVLERQQGLAVAGVYSVALQLAELLWLLSQAVTVSGYARIGAPDRAVAIATTLRAMRIGVAAAALAAPALAMVAWFVLPRVLGNAYRDALWPLLLLLPGVAAYAAASALSAYYTHHRGRPHWAAGIAALSCGLTLLLALVTVPRWGAAGAAAATSIAYLVAIVTAVTLFRRDTGLPWRGLWRSDNAAPARRP
jgi:O-antigen/teichoic acid export membrane protein